MKCQLEMKVCVLNNTIILLLIVWSSDIIWTKMVGGESGIVVIGAFSAWLMQTGKLTRVNYLA